MVRHPLYVGWIIAFWATPTMTGGHILFDTAMTTYILVAVLFEERNLVAHFGKVYQDYRKRVPMFVPRPRKVVDDVGQTAAVRLLKQARPPSSA